MLYLMPHSQGQGAIPAVFSIKFALVHTARRNRPEVAARFNSATLTSNHQTTPSTHADDSVGRDGGGEERASLHVEAEQFLEWPK
jgi:hypothetical protein